MSLSVRIVSSIFILGLAVGALGCGHVDDVQAGALRPHYLRPTPTMRSSLPLVVIYDPNELRDVVPLSVPNGFPHANVVHARSIVTEHLRSGLESLFEHVSITTDPQQIAPSVILCTVRFIDVGLALAPGGHTMVGTLEWSVTLTRPGQPQVLYTWGERTVGTREGAGAFGTFDPGPVVQGAIEASLRAMLKDMNDKGVPSLVTTTSGAAG